MSDSAAIAENSASRHVQTFDSKDLPVTAVTVFTNRAEVRRRFPVKLEAGLTDVVFEVLIFPRAGTMTPWYRYVKMCTASGLVQC